MQSVPARRRPLARPVPAAPPVYEHAPPEPRGPFVRSLPSLLDAVFVVIGLGLSVWLGALYLREGFALSFVRMIYLVAFWVLLTYVALPRLHQLATGIYLPDYFIGRTRTSVGVLSDPLNVALDGAESDLHVAMRRAGWVLADEQTVGSAWRMVVATLMRRSYAAAPMSALFLMGRRQDFAYQQEVGGTTAQRHHVRFWRMPDDFVLPGGQKVQWLAAGTYDRSVGISLFTLQVTHRIDEDIDRERDYIVDTLRFADPQIPVTVIEDFSTAYHHRNGQGDRLRTDGDLPIVDLRGVRARSDGATAVMMPRNRPTGTSVMRSRALESRGAVSQLRTVARPGRAAGGAHRAELADQIDQVVHDLRDAVDNAAEHHLPPPTIALVGALVVLQGALVAAQWIARALGRDLVGLFPDAAVLVPDQASLVQSTVVTVLALALMVGVLRRSRWARAGLMALFSADALGRLLGAEPLLAGAGEHGALAAAGVSVLAVMAITSDAARTWVLTPRVAGARGGGIVEEDRAA
ncbi:LssY C-terminal domain-containing protein [Brachybacterium huguangmaarense]